MNICNDFLGKPLMKGDWVVRPTQSNHSVWMVYSRLLEDPRPASKASGYSHQWEFAIKTYGTFDKKFGRKATANNNRTMMKIEESEVPEEIVKAFNL